MTKKIIAIPVLNGQLSAHFGHCEAFAFAEINNSSIDKIEIKNPPAHQPGVYPKWVAENGATDVIAGGMGGHAIGLFNQFGINVFVGAPIIELRELVQQFLQGSLSLTGNYCDHDDPNHHHHDHGHHNN